ncbi:glutathione S-transferase family protein [Leptolyngbya sp. AN03gr2]|uniref:glutathione S-transferase family protein n=1 Tax=unclassified Leptolyngbya TaxID=2650499 RepID=UPI003D311738
MDNLIVYGVGSLRSLRVHWILHELNIPYKTEPIQSRSEQTKTSAYSAIHPGRKIPCLQDGSFIISESAAICIYLAEKYGEGKFLPNSDLEQRSRFFQMCFYVMTELDAHTLYIIAKHGGSLVEYYQPSPEAVEVAISGFNQQILVAESWLKDPKSYLLGQTFTVADILLCTCLVSALRLAVQFPLQIPDRLVAYMENLQARRAFQLAEIANQNRRDRAPINS